VAVRHPPRRPALRRPQRATMPPAQSAAQLQQQSGSRGYSVVCGESPAHLSRINLPLVHWAVWDDHIGKTTCGLSAYASAPDAAHAEPDHVLPGRTSLGPIYGRLRVVTPGPRRGGDYDPQWPTASDLRALGGQQRSQVRSTRRKARRCSERRSRQGHLPRAAFSGPGRGAPTDRRPLPRLVAHPSTAGGMSVSTTC
jgi:hypothetical protein